MSGAEQWSTPEHVLLDIATTTYQILHHAGAASVDRIHLRSGHTGWTTDEVVHALQLMEYRCLIRSVADADGTLNIIMPGGAWPFADEVPQ